MKPVEDGLTTTMNFFSAENSIALFWEKNRNDLKEIEALDCELQNHFLDKFSNESALNRTLVSFQANKTRPIYRWYKYKEAFSASLVEYLLQRYGIHRGRMLDPFAGSGTALFAASAVGLDTEGIELLPIGQRIIHTRQILQTDFTDDDLAILRRWAADAPWREAESIWVLPELKITRGAYSEKTHRQIEQYLGQAKKESPKIQSVLEFALLCILEAVSYTRKDGQYLRWDHRSGRKQGKKPFDKGEVFEFDPAIRNKINQLVQDLSIPLPDQNDLFPRYNTTGNIHLYRGSCLQLLPTLNGCAYDVVFTSPPYCNRYDYTRTYALELALLGVGEKDLAQLRQEMLSCTVENREKNLIKINPVWENSIAAMDHQKNLRAILGYLNHLKGIGELNNSGIPRMIKGYFHEMACVVTECARILKPGGFMFMVNDNVRYAGASISVDMILSKFAEESGFFVDRIMVLPNGKGNSSQQMGEHGREALRKCVYVWKKC